MEHGTHIDVPLPAGVRIEKGDFYGALSGPYVTIDTDWFLGEYSLDPPPNEERVREDMAPFGDRDDIDQVIEYMKLRTWVLS